MITKIINLISKPLLVLNLEIVGIFEDELSDKIVLEIRKKS